MKIDKVHELKGVAVEDRPATSARYKLAIALIVLILIGGMTLPLVYQSIVMHRVMSLIAALSSNDPQTVDDAARRLSAYDSKWTIRLIIAAYGEASDGSARREGISKALIAMGGRAAGEILAAVRSPDQFISPNRPDVGRAVNIWFNLRCGCIDAAEKMGPRGKPILQSALICGDYDVQKHAVEALVRMRDLSLVPTMMQNQYAYPGGAQELANLIAGVGPAAIGPLTAALQSSDANMSVPAAQILGRLSGAESVNALVAALTRGDPALRMAAAEALGAIGDHRAAAALVKLLDDKEVGTRSAAADALGKIGGDAAEEALLARLPAADQSFQWAVAVALERIGGDDARAAVDSVLTGDDLKSIASNYASAAAGIDAKSLSLSEPVLVIALERYGSLSMAAFLARSPSTVLQDAARFWAKRHHCEKDLDALAPPRSAYAYFPYGRGAAYGPARPPQESTDTAESTDAE